ncbi:MAG: hypothetical protein NT056_04985, partial [Proteobacteria bacterium]|nr:hypothetical protein [Pseudomonadota bacterium]
SENKNTEIERHDYMRLTFFTDFYKKTWWMLFFVGMWLPGFARAADSFPVPVTTEINTLKRVIDPIVIRMEELSLFQNGKIGPLRLMAVRNGAWEVIPFQIDEVDKKGEYLYPVVYKNGSLRESGAGKKPGVVKPRDELVFISRDLGDRADPNQWPAGRGMEIEARDPLDGGRGYAYLFHFPEPPKLSPRDYVGLLPGGKAVFTEEFVFGFNDPDHPAVFNLAAFYDPEAPGDIERAMKRNLLDRLKIRATISFLLGKIRMDLSETDTKGRLQACLDGPVRVIKKYRNWVDLLPGIPSPSLDRLVFSYPNRTVLPNDMYIPFNPEAFISDGEVTVALDFTRRAVGSYLFNPINEKPLLIDGKMSPAEQKVSEFTVGAIDKISPWIIIFNDEGAVMGRFFLSEKIWNESRRLKPQDTFRYSFFYIDDASAQDDPGLEPGRFGEFGFQGKGVASVPQGHYFINVVLFEKKGFKFGEESEFLKVDDVPLEITVRQSPQ